MGKSIVMPIKKVQALPRPPPPPPPPKPSKSQLLTQTDTVIRAGQPGNASVLEGPANMNFKTMRFIHSLM